MTQKNNFTFPRIENVELIKQCYADINGAQSFLPVKNWQTDVWTAEVQCSSGPVLKKAGLAVVEMTGGRVEGASADMTLLQTLAWPVNPCIPGLIIMASTGKIEDQNVMVTVYLDLIIQSGALNQNDKDMLTSALKTVCDRHGQSLDEYQSFLAGRGMLGGCAAECGVLYFFEESDAALLEDMIRETLNAYGKIIERERCTPRSR